LRHGLILALLSAVLVPGYAGTFLLQLDPTAAQSAAPGGTIQWSLTIENLDPSLFLSIDTVNWTAVLDPVQGTPDNFNSFLFPLVAPASSETDLLFSIEWTPGATQGYSADDDFVISTSFCSDSNYNGCVPNDDVTLGFLASVSQPATAAPEPEGLALLSATLAVLILAAAKDWPGVLALVGRPDSDSGVSRRCTAALRGDGPDDRPRKIGAVRLDVARAARSRKRCPSAYC